jgi:hypothetical protein
MKHCSFNKAVLTFLVQRTASQRNYTADEPTPLSSKQYSTVSASILQSLQVGFASNRPVIRRCVLNRSMPREDCNYHSLLMPTYVVI